MRRDLTDVAADKEGEDIAVLRRFDPLPILPALTAADLLTPLLMKEDKGDLGAANPLQPRGGVTQERYEVPVALPCHRLDPL